MLAKQIIEVLGYRDGLFDQLADAVKDALLDWDVAPARGDADGDLLPMAPGAFVEALRPKVEEVLCRLAEAINEAPPDRAAEILKGPVAALFSVLLREAIFRGMQMRVEATEAGLSPTEVPAGAWAQRYRQMRVGRLAPDPAEAETLSATEREEA